MAAALLLLLTAQAMGQTGNFVYQGQTTELSVVQMEGDTYVWELYSDEDLTINFATVPGNCPPAEAYFVSGNTGPTVTVMWLTTGIYFFKVTAYDADSCTNNSKIGKMEVLPGYSYGSFQNPEPICENDTASLTVDITGGIGPWSITYTDGTNSWMIDDIHETPYTFVPEENPVVTTTYWITSVTNGIGLITDIPSDPVILIVNPRPVTSPIYRYDPTSKK